MSADKSPINWPWHLCGVLAALYVVDFWASVFVPQARWMNSYGTVLLCGVLAVGLSLLAAWKASKAWCLVTGAAALTVLFAMYAASV